MIIIGITGGAGAGKSVILDYLQEKYHCAVIQADQVGHQVMKKGQSCYLSVCKLFGNEVLNEEGELDRRKIGATVFSNPKLLQSLNQIIHPAVKQEIEGFLESQKKAGATCAVIEAALLLEEQYDKICHELWYIHASEETRKQRLQSTRGYTEEKIEALFRRQLSEEEFRRGCQVTIENEGPKQDTYRQIDKRMQRYGFM